jgi:hypothetical protein
MLQHHVFKGNLKAHEGFTARSTLPPHPRRRIQDCARELPAPPRFQELPCPAPGVLWFDPVGPGPGASSRRQEAPGQIPGILDRAWAPRAGAGSSRVESISELGSSSRTDDR